MKKAFFAIALACASLTLAHAAPYTYSKSTQGWYISANVALGMATDPDVSASGFGSGEADTELGFGTAIAGGYEWDHYRLEFEYSHRFNNGEIANPTIAGAGGIGGQGADYRFNSFMLNFLYDFYLTDDVYWFNGGGIGFSRVKFETTGGSDYNTVFAWQLMTGLGLDVTENVALTLGYRLFTTRNPDVDILGTTYEAETPFINSIELGIRYNF